MPRVLNKKYWPYQIKMPKHSDRLYITDPDPREQWCWKNLRGRDWCHWGYEPATYAFKREQDATWFALIWGGVE
jgi:hypothetical protein